MINLMLDSGENNASSAFLSAGAYNNPNYGLPAGEGGSFIGIGRFDAVCNIPTEIQPAIKRGWDKVVSDLRKAGNVIRVTENPPDMPWSTHCRHITNRLFSDVVNDWEVTKQNLPGGGHAWLSIRPKDRMHRILNPGYNIDPWLFVGIAPTYPKISNAIVDRVFDRYVEP